MEVGGPMGAELGFADQVTLSRAFEGGGRYKKV